MAIITLDSLPNSEAFSSQKPKLSEDTLSELEELLLGSDLGVKMVQELLADLRSEVSHGDVLTEEELIKHLKQRMVAALASHYPVRSRDTSAEAIRWSSRSKGCWSEWSW